MKNEIIECMASYAILLAHLRFRSCFFLDSSKKPYKITLASCYVLYLLFNFDFLSLYCLTLILIFFICVIYYLMKIITTKKLKIKKNNEEKLSNKPHRYVMYILCIKSCTVVDVRQ